MSDSNNNARYELRRKASMFCPYNKLNDAIKEIEPGKSVGTEAAILISHKDTSEKDKTVSTISNIEEEDWSTNYEICTNIHVVPHKEEASNKIKPRIVPHNETKVQNTAMATEKLKSKFGF